jgi:hypothetical protein
MAYTEVNARRVLARKMYEAQCHGRPRAPTWYELHKSIREDYERAVETLFNLKDEETRDALLVLLHDSA